VSLVRLFRDTMAVHHAANHAHVETVARGRPALLLLICISAVACELQSVAWLHFRPEHRYAAVRRSAGIGGSGVRSGRSRATSVIAAPATVCSHTEIKVPAPWDQDFVKVWTVPEGAIGGCLMRGDDGKFLAVVQWPSTAVCQTWLSMRGDDETKASTKIFQLCSSMRSSSAPAPPPLRKMNTPSPTPIYYDSYTPTMDPELAKTFPAGSSGEEPEEILYGGGDFSFLDDLMWTPGGAAAATDEEEFDFEDEITMSGGDSTFYDDSAWPDAKKNTDEEKPSPIPEAPAPTPTEKKWDLDVPPPGMGSEKKKKWDLNVPPPGMGSEKKKGIDARSVLDAAQPNRPMPVEDRELSDEEELDLYGGDPAFEDDAAWEKFKK